MKHEVSEHTDNCIFEKFMEHEVLNRQSSADIRSLVVYETWGFRADEYFRYYNPVDYWNIYIYSDIWITVYI